MQKKINMTTNICDYTRISEYYALINNIVFCYRHIQSSKVLLEFVDYFSFCFMGDICWRCEKVQDLSKKWEDISK